MAEQMWRVVAVFRVVTLVYAAVLITRDHGDYLHPAAGWLALAVMAVWSVITIAAYSRPRGRQTWLICADVAVAAGLVLSTRLIVPASQINAGAPTIPSSWAASSVLACAVAGGPAGGLAGASVIIAADIVERQALPQGTLSNIVLVLIAGGVGGYIVQLGLRAEASADRAARLEAAIAERERIARGIHDSVLQVLALVATRGRELGGEATELARLAGEQESALRALVSGAAVPPPEGGQLDLAGLLEPLGSSASGHTEFHLGSLPGRRSHAGTPARVPQPPLDRLCHAQPARGLGLGQPAFREAQPVVAHADRDRGAVVLDEHPRPGVAPGVPSDVVQGLARRGGQRARRGVG